MGLISVQYMTLSYLLLFGVSNFPSVLVLDKYGLKIGMICGIGLTAFGLWIRCLLNVSFAFALVG